MDLGNMPLILLNKCVIGWFLSLILSYLDHENKAKMNEVDK